MRITEAMLIIPSLFLLIIGARFFGKGIPDFNFFGRQLTGSVVIIILIIGFTSWMYLARIVRANILSLRERDFVSAARALGASDSRRSSFHFLPNTTAPLVVAATLGVAAPFLPRHMSVSSVWVCRGRLPPGAICWMAPIGIWKRALALVLPGDDDSVNSVGNSTSWATACAMRLIHAADVACKLKIPAEQQAGILIVCTSILHLDQR